MAALTAAPELAGSDRAPTPRGPRRAARRQVRPCGAPRRRHPRRGPPLPPPAPRPRRRPALDPTATRSAFRVATEAGGGRRVGDRRPNPPARCRRIRAPPSTCRRPARPGRRPAGGRGARATAGDGIWEPARRAGPDRVRRRGGPCAGPRAVGAARREGGPQRGAVPRAGAVGVPRGGGEGGRGGAVPGVAGAGGAGAVRADAGDGLLQDPVQVPRGGVRDVAAGPARPRRVPGRGHVPRVDGPVPGARPAVHAAGGGGARRRGGAAEPERGLLGGAARAGPRGAHPQGPAALHGVEPQAAGAGRRRGAQRLRLAILLLDRRGVPAPPHVRRPDPADGAPAGGGILVFWGGIWGGEEESVCPHFTTRQENRCVRSSRAGAARTSVPTMPRGKCVGRGLGRAVPVQGAGAAGAGAARPRGPAPPRDVVLCFSRIQPLARACTARGAPLERSECGAYRRMHRQPPRNPANPAAGCHLRNHPEMQQCPNPHEGSGTRRQSLRAGCGRARGPVRFRGYAPLAAPASSAPSSGPAQSVDPEAPVGRSAEGRFSRRRRVFPGQGREAGRGREPRCGGRGGVGGAERHQPEGCQRQLARGVGGWVGGWGGGR